MLALGLDTALFSCSAALLRDGKVIAARALPLEKGHAEHLAPLAAELFEDAGATIKDLDRIGVVVGPGGFAGVRVGVAFARGLCIGTRAKAVGVTSLEALALSAAGASRLRKSARSGEGRDERGADAEASFDSEADATAAIVNAYRGEVYAALYSRTGEMLIEPFAAAPSAALDRLIAAGAGKAAAIGDGVRLVDPKAEHFIDLGAPPIDAGEVARYAAAAPEPVEPPAPLYLRNPDARHAAPSAFAALLLKEGEH